jgi:hypothetical protein
MLFAFVKRPRLFDYNTLLNAPAFRFICNFVCDMGHHFGMYLAGSRAGLSAALSSGFPVDETMLLAGDVDLLDSTRRHVLLTRLEAANINAECRKVLGHWTFPVSLS